MLGAFFYFSFIPSFSGAFCPFDAKHHYLPVSVDCASRPVVGKIKEKAACLRRGREVKKTKKPEILSV
jgi:hypothetical protein